VRLALCGVVAICFVASPAVAGGFVGLGVAIRPVPGVQLEAGMQAENRFALGGHVVLSGEQYDAAIDVRWFAARTGTRPYLAIGFGSLNIGARFEHFVTLGGGIEHRYRNGFAWAGELAYEHTTRADDATVTGLVPAPRHARAYVFVGARFYF
jgi:hypothetical protein